MEEQIRDFTKGPILRPLLAFSMPILLALFLQALYGAVDLLVVGKYALARDVSGVAIGSQIMQTITGLVSSFAMGTTVLIGQKIGAGKREEGGRIIGTSVAIFFLVGTALTALIPLLSAALARAMNAPEEAFYQTRQYIAICGFGSVMIVAYNVLGSILRGLGDSRTPLMTVAIASACNIAGDLLLVAGLHMGAAGAAIATAASQTISVLISIWILSRRTLPFTFTRRDIRIESSIFRGIVRFGTPIALQDLLVGLSFLVILAIVNSLGLTASAGLLVSCLLGLSLGAGFYTLTAAAAAAMLFCLSALPKLEVALKDRSNHFEVHLELTSSQRLKEFVATIRELGLKIDDIETNPAYINSGLSVYSVAISITRKELKKFKTHREIIDALATLEYVSHIEEI